MVQSPSPDGHSIQAVKNKTLRRRGSWYCTLTGYEVASRDLESSTENTVVCSTRWVCISLMMERAERRIRERG